MLISLESIPSGISFNNTGHVNLSSIKEIPSGVIFNNKGTVDLYMVKKIHPDVRFSKDSRFHNNMTNGLMFKHTQGIAINRIINMMIKKGLFI